MSRGVYGSSTASDTEFRKTWDREEYLKRAADRELAERGGDKKQKTSTEPKELLTSRDKLLNLGARANTTQLAAAPGAQTGFYCKVCDVTMLDSANYLDHINGRRHLAKAGKSTKVEKVSVDRVKDRLEALKKASEKPQYDLATSVQKREEAERLEKEAKKERKKAAAKEPTPDHDEEVAAMMGFGGFGGSRKN